MTLRGHTCTQPLSSSNTHRQGHPSQGEMMRCVVEISGAWESLEIVYDVMQRSLGHDQRVSIEHWNVEIGLTQRKRGYFHQHIFLIYYLLTMQAAAHTFA